MTPELLLILLIITLLTSILTSIAGFGGGILVILFFSFVFDIKTAIALSGIYFFFGNINKCWAFRKTIDQDFVKHLLFLGLPGAAVGIYFFQLVNPIVIEGLLILMGFYLLFKRFIPQSTQPITNNQIVAWGGLWGFLTGLSNALFLRIYLLQRRHLTTHFFVGTGAACSVFVDIVKVGGYYLFDFVTLKDFLLISPLFFISLLGTIIGKKVLDRISKEVFEKIVSILIVFMILKLGLDLFKAL